MASYRFLTADLATGTIREELPLESVEAEIPRLGAGRFSGRIHARHSKATRANLDPGRTLLLIERNLDIAAHAILWGVRKRGDFLELAGAGLWSALERRVIAETRTYPQIDQLVIARDLVSWAQGSGSTTWGPTTGDSLGDLSIAVGTETSGVLRDRTYYGWELKPLGEAVEQLSEVRDGFDFWVSVDWSADRTSLNRTFHLSYPGRGRSTEIVLELGANVEDYGLDVDAGLLANRVHALGEGEGQDMVRTSTSDPGSNYVLLEETLSLKDIKELSTLESHALRRLDTRKAPVTSPSLLEVRLGPTLPFGAWVPGDVVTLRLEDGWVDVDGPYEIESWTLGVDADGAETVDLELLEVLS